MRLALDLTSIWIPEEPPPCAEDPEMFFPSPGDNHLAAAAKKKCMGCDFRAACLEDALQLEYKDDHGIRGGTTREQRRRLRFGRPRRAPLAPTCGFGHEFSKENTMIRANGTRYCRTCSIEGKRRRAARRKTEEAA